MSDFESKILCIILGCVVGCWALVAFNNSRIKDIQKTLDRIEEVLNEDH